MRQHAYAVAEDGAAAEGAGGIYGNDADGLSALAVLVGELVHQRALARARCAGNADDARPARIREERFQNLDRLRPPVFYCRDGASELARIAGAHSLHHTLD